MKMNRAEVNAVNWSVLGWRRMFEAYDGYVIWNWTNQHSCRVVSCNAVKPNAPTQPSSNPQAPTAKNQTPYVNPSKPNTIAPVKLSAPNTQTVNPNTNPQQLNKHPTPTLKPTPTVLPTVKTHKKLRDNDADDLLKAV